jgi:hypothetical protein
MKSRERTAVLDAFTDAIDKDSGLRKQKNNFQILVGTTRLIGTGLQLTRAANLVLMEPEYEFYRELQAVARIHRIGQINQRSYSFRLINEGSRIENKIVKRQEERGEMHRREGKCMEERYRQGCFQRTSLPKLIAILLPTEEILINCNFLKFFFYNVVVGIGWTVI